MERIIRAELSTRSRQLWRAMLRPVDQRFSRFEECSGQLLGGERCGGAAPASRVEGRWDSTVSDAEGHNLRGFGVFTALDELEERIVNLLERFLRERKLIPDGAAWDIATKGSPFPGLLFYDSHFETVFFGRNLAVSAALEDSSRPRRSGARRHCSSSARAARANHLWRAPASCPAL